MFPSVGFGVDLVPRETDDVGQEPFSQAMLADDAGGQFPARRRQRDRTARDLDIARLPQAMDHLGHRWGAECPTRSANRACMTSLPSSSRLKMASRYCSLGGWTPAGALLLTQRAYFWSGAADTGLWLNRAWAKWLLLLKGAGRT